MRILYAFLRTIFSINLTAVILTAIFSFRYGLSVGIRVERERQKKKRRPSSRGRSRKTSKEVRAK